MDENRTGFSEHSIVRQKGAPGKTGSVVEVEEGPVGNRMVRVMFRRGQRRIPEDQLELVPQEESPSDLLRDRKLAGPADLRRTLAHIRLTGRLSDVLYSMETTNTEFYSYQFKPVVRFLQSPSNALLIADEVGLGKTIEAGLIWTELRARHDHRRLLVLCPAVLREKWKWELRSKFGVQAEIVKATECLHRMQDPQSQMYGYAMICSLEGCRPPQSWRDEADKSGSARLARYLDNQDETTPVTDLLIIDEAHKLRNSSTQTNEMCRLFRPVTENLLMLTATPIHNKQEDLFRLLELLDGDIFQRQEDLPLILEANKPLVSARDVALLPGGKADDLTQALADASNHPLLQNNQQLKWLKTHRTSDEWLSSEKTKAELASHLEMVNPLAYTITRTRKRDVKEWRVIREVVPESIPMSRPEEEYYDKITEIVLRYAMRSSQFGTTGFLLCNPQRQMSSSMAASLHAWMKRQENQDDSEAASASPPEAMGPLTLEVCQHVARDTELLDQLRENDSKYARLQEKFAEFFAEHPNEKIVLFATYRGTLNYLHERLTDDGVSCLTMHGGVSQPKADVLAEFENDPSVRVLLSSEVGSEGIDLQFCRVLVNYDLPWNPMKVEQRIGRLDRLGQAAARITIWNLFYADTIDDRIYQRLYEKLNLCKEALGDFEEVLGASMMSLTRELLSKELTPREQEEQIRQTAQALENLRLDESKLESEASTLVAYGDFILDKVQAARALRRWISGEDLMKYVTEFFARTYPGCQFVQNHDEPMNYKVILSPEGATHLEDFIHKNRLSQPTSLIRIGGTRPVCRFDSHPASNTGSGVEHITQTHPLVRFVSDKIANDPDHGAPAVAVRLDTSELIDKTLGAGLFVLAGQRWSLSGIQTTETLSYAAANVKTEQAIPSEQAEQLAASCSANGRSWIEARRRPDLSSLADLADKLIDGLTNDFQEHVEGYKRLNEDRVKLQLENLERYQTRRQHSLEETLGRHQELGRTGLAKATQGKIDKLEERVERQKIKIEMNRELKAESHDVFVAIVEVE